MFYIIGVDHRVQSKPKGVPDSDDQRTYVACLTQAIEQYKPVLVAEEFSDYALRKVSKDTRQEHESLTKATADKIPHRFCDPDPDTRRQLGCFEGPELSQQMFVEGFEDLSSTELRDRGYALEAAKSWPVREQFWLDQLMDVRDKDVVFVCGDRHVESFCQLLSRNGIRSMTVARGIGVSENEASFWDGVMAYLKSHPDLSH
jgi:hypothetical protein